MMMRPTVAAMDGLRKETMVIEAREAVQLAVLRKEKGAEMADQDADSGNVSWSKADEGYVALESFWCL